MSSKNHPKGVQVGPKIAPEWLYFNYFWTLPAQLEPTKRPEDAGTSNFQIFAIFRSPS